MDNVNTELKKWACWLKANKMAVYVKKKLNLSYFTPRGKKLTSWGKNWS
jgi:hypothetical protein